MTSNQPTNINAPAENTMNKALKFAVEQNNKDLFAWVFEQGKPTNIEECLALAIDKNSKEMVEMLVAKIITTKTTKQQTYRPIIIINDEVLDMGVYKSIKNTLLMKTLIKNPVKFLDDLNRGEVSLEEINYQNDLGWTVLQYLCFHSFNYPNADVLVQKLLDLGADANIRNTHWDSPLMLICVSCLTSTAEKNDDKYDKCEKIVETLLKHPKTDVNIKDHSNCTPLMKLCKYAKTDLNKKILKMLLDHPQIDINYQYNGWTALNMASKNPEIVEIILVTGKVTPMKLEENIDQFFYVFKENRPAFFALLKKYNVLV